MGLLSPREDLFQRGRFTLSSGAASAWKIECDSLTEGDVDALGKMISEVVPSFGAAVGVPRGGVRIAAAVEKYATPGEPTVLVVDDVLTTGGSIQRFREQLTGPVVGAVVFARGPCPAWVIPLFSLPPGLWLRRRKQ